MTVPQVVNCEECEAFWSHPGSICRSNVRRDNGSSTSRSPPAVRSSRQCTRHCHCRRCWTACRCGTCRTCHWDRHQSQSRLRRRRHCRQSRSRTSDGTCRLQIPPWTCCSRRTWWKDSCLVRSFCVPKGHICQLKQFAPFLHNLLSPVSVCRNVCTSCCPPSQPALSSALRAWWRRPSADGSSHCRARTL